MESKNNEKKRKSCEYAVTEALFSGTIAMLVDGFNISSITFDSIITYLRELDIIMTPGYYYSESVLQSANICNYINDIYTNKQSKQKKKKCIMFIKNLKNEIIKNKDCPLYHYVKKNMIEKIYVTGKNIKDPEILKLNEGLDNKDAKSDVYIRLKTEPFWCGWSIKQTKKAPKTNYSINSLVSKEEDKLLNNIKKEFLSKHNIPRISTKTTRNERKNIREKGNKLLYDMNNELWDSYRRCINKNNTIIKCKLIRYLFCLKVNYPIYEYDGEKVIDYNSNITKPIDVESILFSEHEPYYFTKKGKPRKTAKMFYKLSFNNISYRFELRFKNSDKYTTNPQLFCFKI